MAVDLTSPGAQNPLAKRWRDVRARWRLYAASAALLRAANVWLWALALFSALAAFGLWRAALLSAPSAPPPAPAAQASDAGAPADRLDRLGWSGPAQLDAVLLAMDGVRERAQLAWGADALSVRALDADQPCGLCRQEIQMTLRGAYAPLRDMIAQLLDRFPTLALVAWDVQRAAAARDEVNAQLRWLFVHAGSADAVPAMAVPRRAAVAPAGADPFALPKVVKAAVRRPAPPQPPPPPPPVVVAPAAPPLPFRFLGRVADAPDASGAAQGPPAVFLTAGQEVLRVKAGDTLLGQYRVDAIEPQAVRLTYLPLNQQQSLLLH